MKKDLKMTFKGKPVTLKGAVPSIGDKAPDFVAVDKDLNDVRLSDFKGKVRIISSAVSLDTSVCSPQLRKFNEEAAKLGEEVVVLNITMDLPFAIARFCATEGIDRVIALSDYKYHSFADAYGLMVNELGLLARAVFVIDREDTVQLAQIVSELASEPDYKCAVEETQKLLAHAGR